MSDAAERYPHPPDEPAAMTALATTVQQACSDLHDVATGVESDAAGLAGAWTGEASAACQAEVATLRQLLAGWAGGMAGGATALTTWAASLQDARDGIDTIRAAYESRTAQYDADLDTFAGRTGPGGVGGAAYQDVISRYRSDIAALDAEYEDELAAVDSAAKAARAALADTVDGIAPPRSGGAAASVLAVLPVLAAARPELADMPTTEPPSMPPAGASPEQVAGWWAGLTPAAQDAAIRAHPEVIGALDGVPVKDRSLANEILLDDDLSGLAARVRAGEDLSGDEQDVLDNAAAVQQQLDTVTGKNDPVTGQPVVAQLWIYEPGAFGGDGRAAIVVGDADTASNVAVTVPGFSADVASYLDNQTGAALNLYDASRRSAPGQSTAVVAWVGYDAPNGNPVDAAGVTGTLDAQLGGAQLASDVNGLLAGRATDPHLTVIGHSYGSTTVGYAASQFGLQADDVVLIGSPGDAVDDVNADYPNVPDDHVWAGANSQDPVAALDVYGDDPSEEGSGATRFNAEDAFGGGHSNYYRPGTESLQNISDIVTGQYDYVETTENRDDTLGPNGDVTTDVPVEQPPSQPILDPDADGDGIADDHEQAWQDYFDNIGVDPPIAVDAAAGPD